MKVKLVLAISFIFSLIIAGNVFAATIADKTDPALFGATLVDFESTALGNYSSLTFGDLTITGDAPLRVSNDINVYFPPADNYLDHVGYQGNFRFSFSTSVSAFGLQIGGSTSRSDYVQWDLVAFDENNSLLESLFFTIYQDAQHPIYTGFFGFTLSNPDISYVLLTQRTSGRGDWIVIDDVMYTGSGHVPVPEPGTLLLLGSGLAGLAVYRRRTNKA